MNIILGHEAHDPTHLNVKLLLSSSISTAGWSLLWLGCSRCLMETKKEKHIQVKIAQIKSNINLVLNNEYHISPQSYSSQC